MNKSVIVTFLVLFCLELPAQECSHIKVSGANDWFPVIAKAPNSDEYSGIAFDLINEVTSHLNLTVQFIYLPWSRSLVYLENGDIDMISAIYWNKERSQKFHYSIPYLQNESKLFVSRTNRFEYDQLEDLIGKQGAIPRGGSFGEAFDSFSKEHRLKLSQLKNKDQMFGMLLNEHIDYVLQDYFDGISYVAKNGLSDRITTLTTPVSQPDIHFAFSKKSPCSKRLDDVNIKLKELISEGFLKRLTEQHLTNISN